MSNIKKILKIKLNADTKNLANLREQIADFLSLNGFDEQKIMQVQLVVDEFCTNIIKYSYNSDPSKTFEITIEAANNEVKIQIIDEGEPFDLTQYKAPNISEHIKHPHKGGLGIPFIKLFSHKIKYLQLSKEPNKNLTEIQI